MKLTPWFPGSRKPVRAGVYIRDMSGAALYAMWTGSVWKAAAPNVKAAASSLFLSINQRKRWRGLAEQPKAAEREFTMPSLFDAL